MLSFWRTLVFIAMSLPLAGCYVLQAAQGQFSLNAKRKPINAVLADASTTPALRARLEYVQTARRFAVDTLHLPDNDSYTTYVALPRRYVVWNVFATPEFSVEAKHWCFPIAGCVVYRGYFHESAAMRYAAKLRVQGYDAAVGGVSAYSTLGHFSDPVMSTMLTWSDAQMAATLFHELAHQVVYVKDDSAFNEAFATTVEEVGLERWLQQHGQSEQLQRWREQKQRGAEFSALLLRTRDRLRKLYLQRLAPEAMRARKQQLLGELKFEYRQLREHWNNDAGYDAWFDRRLSNADFIAIATYQSCVPSFQRALRAVNGDMTQFYSAVKQLARLDKQARQQFCAS